MPTALILVAALALIAAAPATAAEYYKSAGGMVIYMGVLPAAMVRGHPPEHPESALHGGTPAWGEQYHVVVALFDRATGTRIHDVAIKATVFDTRQPGKRLPGPHKELESMLVAGAGSYGNYFNMPAPAPYRIELEIRRPDSTTPANTSFEFSHPHR
ncbi:MAG: hypothetical protein HY322_20655 [Betaproteobacteria bacterium]|nr:hypothetical protein [Betaproteobacteria bacterium]